MTNSRLRDLLGRLWHHIGARRRRHYKLLIGLMLLSAFAEVLSLGAVLPFIAILASPDAALNYPIVASIAEALEITSSEDLVLALTIVFVAAALLAGAIRIVFSRVSTRLTFATGSDLSIELYRRSLYQPYNIHVATNSSEMISGITAKVGHTMLGVLLPTLNLVSSSVLLLAIMCALIAISPVVALVATAAFGVSYGLITWLSRRRLRRNSTRIAREYTQVVKALQEGLGGIRDVLLDGTQPAYCDIYRKADRPLRLAQGDNVFVAQSPRFVMEALGMVLIAALAYWLSHQEGGLAAALPLLGALALGAQRLLPAMQQGYAAWASITGSQASLADTIALLDRPVQPELLRPVPAPLNFCDCIRFDRIRFRYTADGPWVLRDFNLTIPKGSRVGFIGSTGSGKSTTVDLLMGLLTPTEGQLLVDDKPIVGDRIRPWQRAIAHVPQSIYLADSSLAENIAFGVPVDEVDLERVRKAARQAQIDEFIESGRDGYGAMVGERGVRLSGGQRQRIGIARALYKEASVLVLDEATSALDNETEQSVMGAIDHLERELTIVLIAHRLSTVRHCDIVIKLEHGRVVAQGSYDDLVERREGPTTHQTGTT